MIGLPSLVTAALLAILPAGETGPFEAIARDYGTKVRPILKRYCLGCHSTEEAQGELDLERFADLNAVRTAPLVWSKVVEMLDNGEMPPKKKPQPSKDERAQVRDWARGFLDAEAKAHAGDPGPVVLRRLNNVEYDNTIRDLTGVDLRPAREFPVDGAAGEGFTNVGEALAMSPALLDKYVASAKGIAGHAVLLPDSIRFSAKSTRRDWTDEIVDEIRGMYQRYTDPKGATRINLQGLVYETNSGGRIPLELYLGASLTYRDLKPEGSKSIAKFAAENALSATYLQTVWDLLHAPDDLPLIGGFRSRWRSATRADVPAMSAEIRAWQGALTKFNSVAHFKTWMEPVNPLAPSREIRVKLASGSKSEDVILHLVTRDAGDGPSGDVVEWRQPRLERPGHPPIPLRDLRDGLRGLAAMRKTLGEASRYLAAIEDARSRPGRVDFEAVAKGATLDPLMLAAWAGYLGYDGGGPVRLSGLFTDKLDGAAKGWGVSATPNVVANGSNEEIHVPGTIKPHGVAMHPAPSMNVAVGWRSPISGHVRVEPHVVHAHPACGNGVTWSLESRRDGERRILANGVINVGGEAKFAPVVGLIIHEGDLVSLLVGPRDGNHACDLTEIDLTIVEANGPRRWVLSKDVADSILAGNPHADSLGHPGVWAFYQEPITPAGSNLATIPSGSLLDRWREATDRGARRDLAARLDRLMAGEPPAKANDPDAVLHGQMTNIVGPLLGRLDFARLAAEVDAKDAEPLHGLPRSAFGKRPGGHEAEASSLVTRGASSVEVRLPADLAAGAEFVVSAAIENPEGSAQADVVVGNPPSVTGLVPGVPILVRPGSAAAGRFERALAEFRRVFPAALCYPQIVPVDEVVTLVLFHREDEGLSRLMLDEAERRRLDRLWVELRYVSQDALKIKEAYGQFMEYVTQDGDVRLFEPLRKPITERAEALRKQLVATEPRHLDALVALASKAYRRPLRPGEEGKLRDLYAGLRRRGLDHEVAFRLTLARVLVSPSFLYHAEEAGEGEKARPVSPWELASRLSYALWAAPPDDELRRKAGDGTILDPAVLAAETRRMLADDRARALATEFACQWLDIRGFDLHDEKSPGVFPEFAGLRSAMYEESVRFLADLFRRDGSLLDVLDADHTFLNGPLAKHYGIPGVDGPEWRRVDRIKARHRGGILGMATLLSKQSGASRTSPVLRGNWLLEMLLGEKMPKPPKGVPPLPESELDTNGRTMRQMTELHRADPACAKCHDKIDPFGFALEGFDAIGRRRDLDLARRPVDTKARLKDGTEFADIEGLRDYLLRSRKDEFVDQFNRKLLGYALGRSVQLSDGPLLAEMRVRLAREGYRVQSAILAVIQSPQFRMRRGVGSLADRVEAKP